MKCETNENEELICEVEGWEELEFDDSKAASQVFSVGYMGKDNGKGKFVLGC